jgi:hypothetical protein
LDLQQRDKLIRFLKTQSYVIAEHADSPELMVALGVGTTLQSDAMEVTPPAGEPLRVFKASEFPSRFASRLRDGQRPIPAAGNKAITIETVWPGLSIRTAKSDSE